MKKPTLSWCFTWIVFIDLNFTVAFLFSEENLRGLICQRDGGDQGFWERGESYYRWNDFEMGGLIPLYRPRLRRSNAVLTGAQGT